MAFNRSSTSIKVRWAPPEQTTLQGHLQGYEVTYVPAHKNASNARNVLVCNKTTITKLSDLLKYTLYNISVAAFTKVGPGVASNVPESWTDEDVPSGSPSNVSAHPNSSQSIRVSWAPVPRQQQNGIIIKYYVEVHNKSGRVTNVTVSGSSLTALVPDLAVFSNYSAKVQAFTRVGGGPFSYFANATTWEAVPGAPPKNIVPKILGPTRVSVTWDQVPQQDHNGIILGYRVIYRRTENGSNDSTSLTTNEGMRLVLLSTLAKATEYEIKVLAYTSKGDGPPGKIKFSTDEDAPSQAPRILKVESFISLHRVRIYWDPVPKKFLHGNLVDYEVTYQVIEIGFVSQQEEPVFKVPVDKNNASFELNNLEPFAVYKIAVAARTAGGTGPASDPVWGKTCRCKKRLTTSWRPYPPYVNFTKQGEPGSIIPAVLQSMVEACCGHCLQHGGTVLDFNMNGRKKSSMVNSSRELLERVDENNDFAFPVHGHKEQESYKGGFGYVPIVESAGVAFIVYPGTSETRQSMLRSLFLCLPVLLLPIIMAHIAGVIVWILERKHNSRDFPSSFFRGTWEGIWWSFVSMTTLGYGDRAPLSSKGRLFAVLWIMYGIVIIAITMAMLTTALTKITLESEPRLYGSKVAAEMNSPEYTLARRRNAFIDSEYHSLEEVVDALIKRKVEGILVDASSGGLRSDLFNKPLIRVSKILDYKTAYGIVLSPNSTRLRKCFSSYIRSHRAEITEMVQSKIKPIKTSEEQESETEPIPGGLYDSQSPTFQKALKYAAACTGVALFFALVYEFARLLRQHQKVHPQEQYRVVLLREMKALVQEFQERLKNKVYMLKKKHNKELVKLIKMKAKAVRLTGKEKTDWLKSSKVTQELTLDDLY